MSLWDYPVVYLEESKPIHFPSNWPLPNSWVSLSTDGSVRFDEGFTADGGCVRDHNELLGILDGLNLILDRCFEIILIQTNSIEAINVILEDSLGNSNSAL
ncbi:hypothetical protein Golob_018118, partial [Gossypium lobatum]|nr:hypothetical protein [Gossypium lobatum]